MSFATLIMAGAILAGLLCTLVLGLVGTTLLVLPFLALQRARSQPPRRQSVRVARPTQPEMQVAPDAPPTANASPANAVNRSTSDIFDGFTGLYASGLLQ